MNTEIKNFFRPLVPQFILNATSKAYLKKLKKEWEDSGCPVPPPHFVKQMAIREYQEKYHYGILVETGTYLGDMVEAQKKYFKKIVSIELGVELYEDAKKRFINDKNVTIEQGDSGKVLNKVVASLNGPAIFWLDGHYSSGITAQGDKDCPIFEELDAIFNNSNAPHVLLIDDARCFIGQGDYPTIEELTKYVKSKNENYQLLVQHDIIRYFI